MTRRLQDEIKQTRPFQSLEEEVLKGSGLTATQYNVLRILRGAGAVGHSCGDVASRMITRDPDLTRLLDRLEARALVTRARDGEDRRVVITRITREGLSLLAELDEPVQAQNRNAVGHLGEQKLRTLAQLLDEARSGT